MKLTVDMGLCHGHALCSSHAPGLLDNDDHGYAIVLVPDVRADQLSAARRAVVGCPESALALTEQLSN